MPTRFNRVLAALLLALLAVTGRLHAQMADPTSPTASADPEAERLAAAMDSALQAYSQRLQRAVDSVAPDVGDTPHISGYGRIRMDRRSMDVPEITMTLRRRDLSYSLPEVTMRTRSISFDVPVIHMVRVRMGCTPRTKMDGSFPYRIRAWCQPNYVNMPQVVMETTRISTDIPEVAMRLQRMALSIPESRVSMRRISWNWPEYVAECSALNSDACNAERRRQEERAKALEERVGEVTTRARREGADDAAKHVTAFFDYQRAGLQRQQEAMGEVLTTTVRQMEGALKLMAAQGAQNTPEAQETRAALAQIQSTLPAEMEKIRVAIAELSTQEAAIISGLSDGPAS